MVEFLKDESLWERKNEGKKTDIRKSWVSLALVLAAVLAGFAGNAPAQGACAEPPSGLVSWWGGDNNALDIVGDNDATLINGTTYSPGMVGQAFNLDGSNDFVQVASPSGLPLGNAARTMMIWFRTPRDMWASQEGALIQYGRTSGGEMFGLIFSGNASGKLYFFGYGADLGGTTIIQPNTWYHGAVTYDGTTVRLYLNGQEEAYGVRALNTVLHTDGLTMGYRSVDSRWQGELDEPAIFNRVLSPGEIAAIYNAGADGMCRPCVEPPSNLVSWWKGENDGQDSVDINHGTLHGDASFTQGLVGEGFQFDGYGDYMTAGTSGLPSGNSPRTVELWFKAGFIPGINVLLASYGEKAANDAFYIVIISGRLHIGQWGGGDTPASTTVITPDVWYHVAATHDGNTARIYVNGAEEGSASRTFSTTPGSIFYVGCADEIYEHYFPGIIDEVRVYDRALEENEIASIYNAGSAGKCIYHDLTVSKSGTGSGTITSTPAGIDCGSDCMENFLSGTIVTLHAAPEPGHYFTGWTGDCSACGTSPECQVTVNSGKSCTASFAISPPGEAGKPGSPLTASPGTGTAVDISFSPSNCATDHAVYWGTGPISGGPVWTDGDCGFGVSGSASFDPGAPAEGSFTYFVVVGNNGTEEGSYGKSLIDGVEAERPEATGISGCDWPRNLTGACE